MSLWRDDANKELNNRIEHLLDKEGVARWVWVVGNCEDDTEAQLRAAKSAHPAHDIEIVRFDSEIVGDEPRDRVKRLSETANAGFATVRDTDTHWVLHESDLISDVDLVKQLMSTGKDCVAGWVILRGNDKSDMFYDTWAYRVDGQMLKNSTERPPHTFKVDSFGSVWMIPAQALREGAQCRDRAVLDVCADLREQGYTLWVEPAIEIIQLRSRWTSRGHA